jgi:NAD(P)-dependent dehydrogenase (short-subunit alcohol dehydrogenase family)
MKLEGKTALVTGANQGIGQAIAICLAQAGADIVIDYRSHPEGAEETKAKVGAAGRQCSTIRREPFSSPKPLSNTLNRPNALAKLSISVQSMKNYHFPISLPTVPARVA